MTTTPTGLRERFHRQDPLAWAFLLLPDPTVAEIVGRVGFDYALLDCEHGGFDLSAIHACASALQASSTPVMVRVGSHDEGTIHRVLDLGVDGIIVPHVSTGAEARAVVQAIRFPPMGGRGLAGPTRAFGYGVGEQVDPAVVDARTVATVLIESRDGVMNAAEIAATPGLDGIYIGTSDLATDMGLPGEPRHPDVIAAAESVVDVARAAGINVCSPYDIDYAAEHGLTHVSAFADVPGLASAATSALARVRSAVK